MMFCGEIASTIYLYNVSSLKPVEVPANRKIPPNEFQKQQITQKPGDARSHFTKCHHYQYRAPAQFPPMQGALSNV